MRNATNFHDIHNADQNGDEQPQIDMLIDDYEGFEEDEDDIVIDTSESLQYIDFGTSNPYITMPHERIMLREPDTVQQSQYGFTRVESSANGSSPFAGATFHIVRPILFEEHPRVDDSRVAADDDDQFGEVVDIDDDPTPMQITAIRPRRFVIYIEGRADMCFIAHPNESGDTFVLEPFDISLIDKSAEENIADAFDVLLESIAADAEYDDAVEAALEVAGQKEPAKTSENSIELELLSMQLLRHLSRKTAPHPFRASDN